MALDGIQRPAAPLVPVPDPTAMTTVQLDKAIENLSEITKTRLDAMDQATELRLALIREIPEQIRAEVMHLRLLQDEKFAAVDTRLRDWRDSVLAQIAIAQAETARVGDVSQEKFAAIDGTFQSNALALTAALAAQKEAAAEQNKSNTLAITKSEQATKETISSNAAQNQTGTAALAASLADLKERIVRIETGGTVTSSNRTEHRLDWGTNIAAFSALIALISIIVAVYFAAHH